jgi:hypothetical protein
MLNFDKWTYSDFANAFNHFRDGNSEAFNGLLTKATGKDFDDMPLEDAAKAAHEAIMSMNKFVEKLDFTECTVDFKAGNWSSKEYRNFQKAMNSRNIQEVENLIRQVAFMDDVEQDSDAPLSARQGCIMVRAITQKYQDILTGKS